jgi:hypothetical protein
MIQIRKSFKARAEAFCAKLNNGLAAVAIVLAITVGIAGTYRTVALFEDAVQQGQSVMTQAGQPPLPY